LYILKTKIHDNQVAFSTILEFSGFNQRVIEKGITSFLSDVITKKLGDHEEVSIEGIREIFLNDPLFSAEEVEYLMRDVRGFRTRQHFRSYLIDSVSALP
jgi:DNA-directed RNA polymerase